MVASKLKQHQNAVMDASKVIDLCQAGSTKGDLLVKATMRKGLGLFELERYDEAHRAFSAVLAMNPDDAMAKQWLRKSAAEIKASKFVYLSDSVVLWRDVGLMSRLTRHATDNV